MNPFPGGQATTGAIEHVRGSGVAGVTAAPGRPKFRRVNLRLKRLLRLAYVTGEGSAASDEVGGPMQFIPRPRPPATLRPDWKMPEAPLAECPQCRGPLLPNCFHTGDAIALCWDCTQGCQAVPDDIAYMIDVWPFVEEIVTLADFGRIGFMVEGQPWKESAP
jgi:hypothetical protein